MESEITIKYLILIYNTPLPSPPHPPLSPLPNFPHPVIVKKLKICQLNLKAATKKKIQKDQDGIHMAPPPPPLHFILHW